MSLLKSWPQQAVSVLSKASAWARRFPEGGARSVQLDLKLLAAAQASNLDLAARCIRRGARPCAIAGVDQTNAWMEAIHHGDYKMAVVLAQAGPKWAGYQARAGAMTPLMRACAAGEARIAYLLGHKVEAYEKDISIAGETALSHAVRSGHPGCVEAALSQGALEGTEWTVSPLTIAASMGRADLIKILARFGKPPTETAIERWSGQAMRAAIEAGSFEALKALFDAFPQGAHFYEPPSSAPGSPQTPWGQRERALELAVKAGRSDMTALLGVASQDDHYGSWAWTLAIRAGDLSCLEALARTRDQSRSQRGLSPFGPPWMPRLERGNPAHEAARAAFPEAAALTAERCDLSESLSMAWYEPGPSWSPFELCWKDDNAPADRVAAVAKAFLMASPLTHLPALAHQAARELNQKMHAATPSSFSLSRARDSGALALAKEAVLLWTSQSLEAARLADGAWLNLWHSRHTLHAERVGSRNPLIGPGELDQTTSAQKRLEEVLLQTLRDSVSPDAWAMGTPAAPRENKSEGNKDARQRLRRSL